MPIVSSVHSSPSTNDPREAVRECLRLVRAHAASLEPLEVHLFVGCGANNGVIMRLAGHLPIAALAFRPMGSDRALTAAQFRIQPPSSFSTFEGNLTDHFPPSAALDLIEELLACPPGAIRSTTIHVTVRKFQWKGAPPGCSGEIGLFDLKHADQEKRFSLTTVLEVPGNNPKSSEVLEAINQVAQATGIGFDKEELRRTPGEKYCSPEYAKEVLIGQICFNEAVEDLASQLSARWVSEFAPNALPPRDAFQTRMHRRETRAPEKVNLTPLLKRITKELLPELKFDLAEGDDIDFKKELGPESEIVATFTKTMVQIGKAFELSLGVRSVNEWMRFTTSVFQFERSTEQRIWIYASAAEAEEVVREAVNLLKEFLPRFESAARKYFATWPKELPDAIEHHGNLTARQAFDKALSLARSQFSDAVLTRLTNHPISLRTRDIEGSELGIDGRLTPNGQWWFHFHSPMLDTSFEVAVPAVGRIRISYHGNQYKDDYVRRFLVPVGDEWMDSDRALALAEERGGQERRESGKAFGIMTKLQLSPSGDPCWGVMYGIADERGRNDLILYLDALTGESIHNIHGF
jgi:hypothetical protein